jgi:serralysin
MIRRTSAVVACLAALAATAGLTLPGPAAGQGTPPYGEGTAGPPYDYTTELMGGGTLISLPDKAMITRTEHGYLFRAGQQDTHLVITLTAEGLRFEDSGTASFKRLARRCKEITVKVGVAAVCRVPLGITADQPLLLEIWPRLGDDYVDGSTLPDTFAMTVLSDAGHDTALFGAGPDFFNGFTGRDQVWGGGGNDWIRTGQEADTVYGGDGDDQIVGTDGPDTMYGEAGDDLLGGGDGADRLDGGAGADALKCNGGRDVVWSDGNDRLYRCETVNRG